MSSSSSTPLTPAHISTIYLEHHEVPRTKIEQLTHITFAEVEEPWLPSGGSPFQQWYRTIATGPTAVRDLPAHRKAQGLTGRLIAWKSGTPFLAKNLFFRSLDTGKLLPMHLADFNVQMYAHPSEWARLETAKPGWGAGDWRSFFLLGLMHELLLLRNMHDRGGGDIPIIFVGWDAEYIARAMDYWVGLSKGTWSDAERDEKYTTIANSVCRRILPCFPQVDLLVRSLLSDPSVGYVPPFIIFYPLTLSGRATALFTSAANQPPVSLTSTFPQSCNKVDCGNDKCGFFDFAACRALEGRGRGGEMVRESVWPTGEVGCNVWMCGARHAPREEGGKTLMRCRRCKETMYCCVEHQTLDWKSHKTVCEAPPPGVVL
ncbi:hypothetical protein Hypma_005975 [Hypsizygus marmoreus]|uniref:MYND-type domain-containing protein n=1 Tax=Hypsizygus marmoreus TaxID=39966 RepID=A0A369KD96_HYPMA|nr:hypothetical protein Hypma_005975 [Hypsizygus marmoreus]